MNVDLAIRLNRVDWLEDLLSLGLLPDIRSGDYTLFHADGTALMVASFWKRLDAARHLLAAGADPEATDAEGWTALLYSVYSSESIKIGGYARPPDRASDLVRLLLDAGAQVDHRTTRGWTAWMLALRFGRLDVAAELERRGAQGQGAQLVELARAAEHGDLEGIRRAVADGADADAWTEPFGDTPLSRACYWSGSLAVVETLLDLGASVDRKDARGRTPLMVAAGIESHNWHDDHPRIAARLIAAGASLDEGDQDGETALSLAQREGHDQAAELLRRAGAGTGRPGPARARSIEAGDVRGAARAMPDSLAGPSRRWLEEWLATGPALPLINAGLLSAAADGVVELVDRFLIAGAEPASMTSLGETALKNAAAGGHAGVVRRLLEAGLDRRSPDAMVARRWALYEGHPEVASLIDEG